MARYPAQDDFGRPHETTEDETNSEAQNHRPSPICIHMVNRAKIPQHTCRCRCQSMVLIRAQPCQCLGVCKCLEASLNKCRGPISCSVNANALAFPDIAGDRARWAIFSAYPPSPLKHTLHPVLGTFLGPSVCSFPYAYGCNDTPTPMCRISNREQS